MLHQKDKHASASTTITTMATAARNGPLPPHMRSNFECMHIKLIGDDPQVSKYAFLWQWEGLWPLKRTNDEVMMAMNLTSPSSILSVIDPLIAREKYFRLLRGSSPINPTRRHGVSGPLCVAWGPFPVTAAMMIKIVVGRWPLVTWWLLWFTYTTNSFCLKYLGWSEIY